MNNKQKIESLRKIMTQEEVQGFIVPRTDENQGEYVPACAERLKWLTGFTGSAGVAVVLEDKAVVMSDGRYTFQLAQQVDGDLYETENSQEVKLEDWLKKNAKKGVTVAYDPRLHSVAEIEKLEEAKLSLKPVAPNLIDQVWTDKPSAPSSNVDPFPVEIAGKSSIDKVNEVVEFLKEQEADAVILTLSDSIAWLLNIRGFDIPHIPVALSYAIVFADGSVQWFINEMRVSNAVRETLPPQTHILRPNQIDLVLQKFAGLKIMIDPKRSSVWFERVLRYAGAEVIHAKDPCVDIRACKTPSEQEAMKAAHVRDGVAMVKFLKWFSEEAPKETLSELSVEERLNEFRAQAPEFQDTSFDTIAGYGSNGAIVHYRASEESNKDVKSGNLLLLDSGAQYSDGTTDITRTLAVGAPTAEMMERNTYVLKAHIALAMAVFKKDTSGKELDAICRAPMKKAGLDYLHGTGHGVGCYLSVHEEAAMGISPRAEEPLQAGMILSNEPGYYEEDAYGIRIENLILVKEGEGDQLSFETITLAPFDRTLIDVSLLNDEERHWVDQYHARVNETLSPLLDDEHQAWLKKATLPL
ncbi:MAG: aminopeptidase P family protein [Alphaproteobacteria bacterium]|nr:aminopeptidase P family protein [Alphaproteobacteria bacterium]